MTRTYGAAETAGGCVWDGAPLPPTEVSIIEGRVALSGPMLAGGYLGDPERAAQHFVNRGDQRWFVTDDLGRFEGGVLTVTGRADDVIISGGVKVSLADVERVVREGGAGLDAVVVAVEDEAWGQVPVVVATRDVSLQALRLLVAQQLGDAARPHAIYQVREIPLLPSGKVDRQAVIERVRNKPN